MTSSQTKPKSNLVQPSHFPPKSIAQLTELAKVSFQSNLPINSYVRSAEMLYQQSKTHQANDQLDLAFIYLLRATKITLEDLPTHPEYDSLPSAYQSQIQADGIKYLDALVPIRSKLNDRHLKYLELQASLDHHPSSLTPPQPFPPSSDPSRRGPLPSSTASSSTSSPPLDPSSPSPQSSCNSRKLSGSLTPASSISNSPPQPDACRLPNPPKADPIREPSADLGDWTLIEPPPPPPPASRLSSRKPWQPLRKNKPSDQLGSDHSARFKTHPPLSSSSRLPQRNDLIWPVELGNGQGERMSVAPPIEQVNLKPRAASHDIPRSVDICCATGPWVTIDRPSQVPFRLSQTKPNPPLHSSGPPPINEQRQHPTLYNLDNHVLDRSAYLDQILTQPSSSSSITFVQPTRKNKSSILTGRFALSTDNVSVLDNDDPKKSPSGHHHSNSIPTFSSLKSFVRPRHLSWTASSSSPLKSKPSKSDSPLSPVIPGALSNSTLAHSPPSHPSSPPVRSKRGSFGESSTWRWLKGLNLKPSDARHKSQAPSSVITGSSLYSDLPPPSQEPTSSIHSSIFSLVHTPNCHPKRPSNGLAHSVSDSNFPNSYVPVIGSTGSARPHPSRRPQPPVLPPKDPKMDYSSTKFNPSSPVFPHHHRQRVSRIPFPGDASTADHGAKTQDSSSQRRMKCPKDLVGAFVAIAEPETEKGIELCGLLLGVFDPKQDALVINTLLIPKQVCTSDTCNTFNEDEMFKYQDRMGLMTLGWIHTHPTQTCFMSSVDLHTQLSYQLMLPEAIAIVCSPKKDPSIGIYQLIDPDGIQTILNCKQSAMFHPHPNEPAIYRDVEKDRFRLVDGAVELQSMKLEIMDLR